MIVFTIYNSICSLHL